VYAVCSRQMEVPEISTSGATSMTVQPAVMKQLCCFITKKNIYLIAGSFGAPSRGTQKFQNLAKGLE
ncbi:hypothetical protein SK128_005889, partial [Halocaridina rubra]